MNSVEINDKEKQLRSEAETIINAAKIEGRKLNDEENERFTNIQKELNEVKENRALLDKQLKELNKEAKVEVKRNEINKNTNMEENKNFRLLDTINAIVNNRQINDVDLEVIKRGQEQMKLSGQSYSGQIQMPVNTRSINGVITAGNVYTAGTYNGGKEAVPTDTFDIVTGLYGNLGLSAAGSTFMSGLIGNIEIPTYTGTTVGWGTEVADAANGTGTFGSVSMSPKRLTAYVDISKQFLIQTSDTAEQMLRQDIINALSAKIEKTLLQLTATDNAPAPIATTATHITTAEDWYGLISDLEDANFYGDFNVVISPALKASLRGVKLDSGSGKFLFEDGELDGYPTHVSSNVYTGKGYIGVFPELVIGQWGAIDIIVDPYSVAAAGKVRIVVNAYFDAALRREGAIKAFDYVAPQA